MASSTKKEDSGFNIAEELLPKTDKGFGKPGWKPRYNSRNSHREKFAARTAAATRCNTTVVEQQLAEICHKDAAAMDNGTTSSAPSMNALLKEQFTATKVHLEGFVTNLIDTKQKDTCRAKRGTPAQEDQTSTLARIIMEPINRAVIRVIRLRITRGSHYAGTSGDRL